MKNKENSCLNTLTTIKLTTTIGSIQIRGCSQGLHMVKRDTESIHPFSNNVIKCDYFDSNDSDTMIPLIIKESVQWFHKYFNQPTSCKELSQPLLLCPMIQCTDFAFHVYEALSLNVKFGQRCTYSKLAEMAGYPKAARAVGSALRKNPLSIIIPCHRVVPKSGQIGKYGGKEDPIKQWLLNHENLINLNN